MKYMKLGSKPNAFQAVGNHIAEQVKSKCPRIKYSDLYQYIWVGNGDPTYATTNPNGQMGYKFGLSSLVMGMSSPSSSIGLLYRTIRSCEGCAMFRDDQLAYVS